MGGDGGCRVGEVWAGTTSPTPDHKDFKLQELVNFRKFSTLRVKHISFLGQCSQGQCSQGQCSQGQCSQGQCSQGQCYSNKQSRQLKRTIATFVYLWTTKPMLHEMNIYAYFVVVQIYLQDIVLHVCSLRIRIRIHLLACRNLLCA